MEEGEVGGTQSGASPEDAALAQDPQPGDGSRELAAAEPASDPGAASGSAEPEGQDSPAAASDKGESNGASGEGVEEEDVGEELPQPQELEGAEVEAPGDGTTKSDGSDKIDAEGELMDDAVYQTIRERVLVMINEARDAQGLKPLQPDHALASAADAFSKDMCQHSYLSHFDRQGRKPYHRYASVSSGHHVVETHYGADLEKNTEE
ncbi:unnamed protein product, partial [Chrysoparadoxa australica]